VPEGAVKSTVDIVCSL